MTLTHEEMIEIAAQREAKNNKILQEQKTVIERIEEMCEVLRTNYQTYSIEMHRISITKGIDVEYHQRRIDELSMGEGVYNYTYEKGRKYAKIVMHSNNSRSAHAFVDLKTGDVFKATSWKSPAKGVRYNLLDDKSREEMYQRSDWSGGYLYK